MVTLVQPLNGGTCGGLWRLVWSNVPEGRPIPAERAVDALPWLRTTRTSDNGEIVTPDKTHVAEAFFGMPRRLRLVCREESVTGVVQRPYGTRYAHWSHPLSPYYRRKPDEEPLPVHPSPGRVSYRNWLGLAFGQGNEQRTPAASVRRFHSLTNAPAAEVLAGGWAMSNMKPLDFDLHVYPTFRLDESAELRTGALVEAANSASQELMKGLKKATGVKVQAFEPVREAFFAGTESDFVEATKSIAAGVGGEVEQSWLSNLRRTALTLFDRQTVPALTERRTVGNTASIEATVNARRNLLAAFSKPTGVRKALALSNDEQEDME